MKKIISMLAAIALASAAAVSAMAVDYAEDVIESVAPVSEVVSAGAVQDAIAQADDSGKIVLDFSGSDGVILTADVLAVLAAVDGGTVEIDLGGYAIQIDTSSIDITTLANIDLRMNISTSTADFRPSAGEKLPGDAIVIQPSFSGEIPFTVTVVIPAADLVASGIDPEKPVAVYHVDSNGNITRSGDAVLGDDGSLAVSFNSASYYFMSNDMALATVTETTSTDDGKDVNPSTGVILGAGALLASAGTAGMLLRRRK